MILAGFLVLILLGLAGGWALRQAERQDELVLHTFTVENALYRLTGLNERLENARRGFLLSADESFAQRVETVAGETQALGAELAALTSDNAEQRARVDRLADLSQAQIEIARRSLDVFSADPAQEPSALFLSDDGLSIIMEIRALARETVEEERALLDVRAQEQTSAQRLVYVILATALILLIAVAAGTIWMVRRNGEELRRSRNVLRGMNEMLEGAVQVRTADLQRANAEIQRFAYIVSHDLRSPLVNVMGFTSELDSATGELRALLDRAEERAPDIVTEGARLAVREDLPEAIGFIRSSTQKMDRLINAILRLSREGRRVITLAPLDMDALVATIVDSLQHRLSETKSSVTTEGSLPTIVSDQVAVEQIVSNLVENAVKYRRPDRPVHVVVRGRKVGTRVVFEIEDDGRGIDPKDHERVFDLFRRSGSQDQPGEGIGLAHVRAMAYRLGGSVSCESALGEGATFRLSLPETFEGSQEG